MFTREEVEVFAQQIDFGRCYSLQILKLGILAFLGHYVPYRLNAKLCTQMSFISWGRAQVLSDFQRRYNPKRLRTTAKTK